MHNFFISAMVMMAVAYAVRAVPFTLFRRKVRNRFMRSFLYYIPYAVLTAMTVPAAWYATSSFAVSSCGLGIAAILAYRGRGLVVVSLAACAGAFAMMLLLRFAG